jgi:deoxyribodipyrimidine photo-lyase
VPELAPVPDALVHEPWRWDGAGGLDYPAPVVDHKAAARAARDAIWSLRRARDFERGADAIQDKHGSRKSGLAQTGQGKAGQGRRKRRKSEPDERQGRFL